MPKFQKGNPGGPGRPRGSRNAVNLMLDRLAVEAEVRKMGRRTRGVAGGGGTRGPGGPRGDRIARDHHARRSSGRACRAGRGDRRTDDHASGRCGPFGHAGHAPPRLRAGGAARSRRAAGGAGADAQGEAEMSLKARLKRLEAQVEWLEVDGMLRLCELKLELIDKERQIADHLAANPEAAALFAAAGITFIRPTPRPPPPLLPPINLVKEISSPAAQKAREVARRAGGGHGLSTRKPPVGHAPSSPPPFGHLPLRGRKSPGHRRPNRRRMRCCRGTCSFLRSHGDCTIPQAIGTTAIAPKKITTATAPTFDGVLSFSAAKATGKSLALPVSAWDRHDAVAGGKARWCIRFMNERR